MQLCTRFVELGLHSGFDSIQQNVPQRQLMRLFEGDTKPDILNSTYCSISEEHFDTKTIFILYSYQKL